MKKSRGKAVYMPAQPTQDSGSGPAPMPGVQPMSTPTAPSVSGSVPKSGSTPVSLYRGTSNSEDTLPPHAFHKGRGLR